MATHGAPNAEVNRGISCVKGYFLSKIMYGADRLTEPLLRMKDGKYDKSREFQAVSWDKAFDAMAEQFKRVLKEKGPAGVGTDGPMGCYDDIEQADLAILNCHQFQSMDFTRQSPRAVRAHSTSLERGERTCIDCHAGIAHRMPDISEVETLARAHGGMKALPAIISGERVEEQKNRGQ